MCRLEKVCPQFPYIVKSQTTCVVENIVDEGCVEVIAVDEQTVDKNIVGEGCVDVIDVDKQTVDKRILEE